MRTEIPKLSQRSILGSKLTAKIAAEMFSESKDKGGKIVRQAREIIPLYIVAGFATGIKTGESNFGPWTGFKGDFIGHNLANGEEFESNILLGNETITAQVTAKLGAVSAVGKPVDSAGKSSPKKVRFAYRVSIKKSGKDFVYATEEIVSPEQNDDMKALLELVKQRLSSPKK